MRLRLVPLLALVSLCVPAQVPKYANKLVPYVSSPVRVVDRMLELANIKPGETVLDLGSGDGRILIAAVEKYKAKAIGIEISTKLVAETTARIQNAGLSAQAKVIQGDLLTIDLPSADVVTIYLDTAANRQVRPRLEKLLKPGARVISHDYAVPGWKPNKIDKPEGENGHVLYYYEMPPAKQ